MKFGLSDDIYEKIKKIADKYNKYKFKIFGSRARGDYRSNSDIDIAIEGNIDKKDKFNIVNEEAPVNHTGAFDMGIYIS